MASPPAGGDTPPETSGDTTGQRSAAAPRQAVGRGTVRGKASVSGSREPESNDPAARRQTANRSSAEETVARRADETRDAEGRNRCRWPSRSRSGSGESDGAGVGAQEAREARRQGAAEARRELPPERKLVAGRAKALEEPGGPCDEAAGLSIGGETRPCRSAGRSRPRGPNDAMPLDEASKVNDTDRAVGEGMAPDDSEARDAPVVGQRLAPRAGPAAARSSRPPAPRSRPGRHRRSRAVPRRAYAGSPGSTTPSACRRATPRRPSPSRRSAARRREAAARPSRGHSAPNGPASPPSGTVSTASCGVRRQTDVLPPPASSTSAGP